MTFKQFFDVYPRKLNKSMAEKAYNKALKVTDAETIIYSSGQYAAWVQRTGTASQFVCHPTSWLNQRRWENDYASMDNGPIPQKPHTEHRERGANAVDAAFFNIMQQMER